MLATTVAPVAPRLSDDEVKAGLTDIDGMRARTETLTLHMVTEALERRLPSKKGLTAHDWLTVHCPWLAPMAISDLVTVARGMGNPLHAKLHDEVMTTGMPVRRAASILRALARVKPFMDTIPDPDAPPAEDGADVNENGDRVSEYEAALARLMSIAGDKDQSDKALRRATDRMTSAVLPEKDHDTKERAINELRGVNESSLADGSLVRFIVTANPEGAALFRSIFHSPLAAPSPDETGPDERTASQRRYDALITVMKRGIAGSDSAPTTPKATVNVTIRWDLLRHSFTGTGTTDTGETLCPETVRRMACDADIIPMILGTDNEILNQGRAKRLITPGQRRALHHRDKHCTFPGCSTPAPWCDATTSNTGHAAGDQTCPTTRCYAGGTTPSSTNKTSPRPSTPPASPGTSNGPAPHPATLGRVKGMRRTKRSRNRPRGYAWLAAPRLAVALHRHLNGAPSRRPSAS